MKITELQHEDSIWVWPSMKAKRASLWIPYIEKIEKIRGGWNIVFNGGNIEFSPKEINFLLIYGTEGHLPIQFLEDLRASGAALFIHRRNIKQPYMFFPPPASDDEDILTAQIICRENLTRCSYVARELVAARLKSFRRIGVPVPSSVLGKLRRLKNIDKIRTVEAKQSRRYWERYYNLMGLDISRRERHPLNAALDAGSLFLSGVVLRWILYHKLSPVHGFLHLPSSYPALVYDLMEPYRYMIEEAVRLAYMEGAQGKKLTAATFYYLKDLMQQKVYVPMTRQSVRQKNLLHGGVLALRAYLLGEMKRIVFPVEGKKGSGRPAKISYKMPGQIWSE